MRNGLPSRSLLGHASACHSFQAFRPDTGIDSSSIVVSGLLGRAAVGRNTRTASSHLGGLRVLVALAWLSCCYRVVTNQLLLLLLIQRHLINVFVVSVVA